MTREIVAKLKERGAMLGRECSDESVGIGRTAATLAVAESCTGGRLAAVLTAEAGASEFFLGGVVAYANEVKMGVLGVSSEALEHHGAVSREVATEMAVGARRVFGADYALATTGIAGPDGGTPEKPVGTVWIALAGPDGNVCARKMHFDGKTRTENMESAVSAAIGMLQEEL